MTPEASGLHMSTVLLLLSVVCADDVVISALPRDNVTLPCSAESESSILVVEWKRQDLEPPHIYLYWERRPHPEFLHPLYVGRVELQDEQVERGDVSLTVSDVTPADTGSYECYVIQEGADRRQTAEPLRVINLTVAETDTEICNCYMKKSQTDSETFNSTTVPPHTCDAGVVSHVVSFATLSVLLVLMVAVVTVAFVSCYKRRLRSSTRRRAADEAVRASLNNPYVRMIMMNSVEMDVMN